MDRNELLTTTRHTFLRVYGALLDMIILCCAETLLQRADRETGTVEQRQILDARTILKSQHDEIKHALASHLAELLSRSLQTAYNTFRPSYSSVPLKSLSLLGSAELDGELRIDEITKRLRHAADEPLRDLNVRMAVIFEQDVINERENPLRPYLLTRSIQAAIAARQLQPVIADLIVDALSQEIALHIAFVYDEINDLLAAYGIAAELTLRVKRTPSWQFSAKPVEQGDEVAPSAAPSSHDTRAEQLYQSVRRQAHRGFSDDDDEFDDASQIAHSAVSPRISWLGRAQNLGTTMRQFFAPPAGSLTGAGSISERLSVSIDQLQVLAAPPEALQNVIFDSRKQLSEASQTLQEQMVIDIVGMLFEFILRDPQIPAEIRAQLGRLQLRVLKTALHDPVFFAQKHHPARLLVNRIGSMAPLLPQLQIGVVSASEEIKRIIETLLNENSESAELFSRMLAELEAYISAQLRQSNAQLGRVADALETAEDRSLRYARIKAQINDALARFTLEPVAFDFLSEIWAYAIEAGERSDVVDALRYRMLLPEFLWSIAPKQQRSDVQQLLSLIPKLLATINEGLALTPWGEQEQNQFKNWLVDTHRHALRGQVGTSAPQSLEAMRLGFAEFIGQTAAGDTREQRIGTVNEVLLDQLIQEMSADLDRIEALFGDFAGEAASCDVAENATLFAQLRSGIEVEMNLLGAPMNAHLCWMSPAETSLLLKLDGQDKPSLISVVAFRRLLSSGRAVLKENQQLFERAMESVLQSADEADLA